VTKLLSHEDELQDLFFLFSRAYYMVYRNREKEYLRLGLSPEQAQVLFIAQASGNKTTPTEIARLIVRRHHSVSALVNRMADKGLIRKVKNQQHKNWMKIIVNGKGEKAANSISKIDPVPLILDVLNRKERQALHRYLEKILEKASGKLGLNDDPLPPS